MNQDSIKSAGIDTSKRMLDIAVEGVAGGFCVATSNAGLWTPGD